MHGASLSRFLDALAFFTCLVPARMCSGSALPSLLPWFGPAGLVLGLACTGAAALLSLHLAGSAVPVLLQAMLAGFAWLAAEMLLSRALHWDGLCDVADALGSFRTGDAFWEVMKDSRIGAFGAAALAAVFAGQLLCASAHAASANWLVLALAPAWSRCQASLVFCFARQALSSASPRRAIRLPSAGALPQGRRPGPAVLRCSSLASWRSACPPSAVPGAERLQSALCRPASLSGQSARRSATAASTATLPAPPLS